MAGNCPNDEDRDDRINQGEKQAAVESRSRPERRRGPQPEGTREERPVGHACVAEEAVNPVEKPGETLGVEAGCNVSRCQAAPERVIRPPLGWPPQFSAENAEVAAVYERQR